MNGFVNIKNFRDKDYIAIETDNINEIRHLFHPSGDILLDGSRFLVELDESTIFNILVKLKEKGYLFSEQVSEIFNNCTNIIANTFNYIPHLSYDNGYVLKNCNQSLVEHFNRSFGDITDDNLTSAIQALKKYGVGCHDFYIDNKIMESDRSILSNRILLSSKSAFIIDPVNYTMAEVMASLDELNSFPLLVVFNTNTSISEMRDVRNILDNYVNPQDMVMFFRLENKDKRYLDFINFIKDYKWNNFVSSTTKVVFIQKNKVPKALLTSGFQPTAVLSLFRRTHGKISAYYNSITNHYFYTDAVINAISTLVSKQFEYL